MNSAWRIPKYVVVVVAALAVPLAACSRGGVAKGEVVLSAGKGGAKGAAAAGWMNGPGGKDPAKGASAKNNNGISLGKGGGGKQHNTVKIPKIGSTDSASGKKKGKGA